jgi:hypothetical protein
MFILQLNLISIKCPVFSSYYNTASDVLMLTKWSIQKCWLHIFEILFYSALRVLVRSREPIIHTYIHVHKRIVSNTLDFISTDDLPGTHTFLQNVNSSESPSPRCTGYSDASPNSLPATNSSSIKQYSNLSGHTAFNSGIRPQNSNIKILERFQSKVLRLIANARWYVPNSVIHKDLRIPSVKEEISRFSSHYDVRISVHPHRLTHRAANPQAPASILAPRPSY